MLELSVSSRSLELVIYRLVTCYIYIGTASQYIWCFGRVKDGLETFSKLQNAEGEVKGEGMVSVHGPEMDPKTTVRHLKAAEKRPVNRTS